MWGRRLTSFDALAIAIALAVPAVGMAGQVKPAASANPAAAAKPAKWTQARTPWGDPDLQGHVWNFATMVPFERPAAFAGKEVLTDEEAAAFERQTIQGRVNGNQTAGPDWWDPGTNAMRSRQTSLVVDPANGRLPALTPEAEKRTAARNQARRAGGSGDNPEDQGLNVRCIAYPSAGPPMAPGVYNNNVEFFQTRGYIVIFNEMIHDARIIPLDGRPHGTLRQWMGDSRGHWEGQTLVVDTVNFTDKTAFRGSSENLHLVERFTQVDENTIDYQFTASDPTTWVRPWTARFPLTKIDGLMYEYACSEGNYLSMRGILTVARFQENATNK